MQTCEFCGSRIPEYASFCGQCGRVPSIAVETQTMASDFHMPDIQEMDTATNARVSGNFLTNSEINQQSFISNAPTSLPDQEEEEERRRRAVILGMGVPLLGSLAVEGLSDDKHVPMVQGTPQIDGIPAVQGTPNAPAGSIGQRLYSSPTVMAPQLPSSVPVSPVPIATVNLHHPHDAYPPHHPQPVLIHLCTCIQKWIIGVYFTSRKWLKYQTGNL